MLYPFTATGEQIRQLGERMLPMPQLMMQPLLLLLLLLCCCPAAAAAVPAAAVPAAAAAAAAAAALLLPAAAAANAAPAALCCFCRPCCCCIAHVVVVLFTRYLLFVTSRTTASYVRMILCYILPGTPDPGSGLKRQFVWNSRGTPLREFARCYAVARPSCCPCCCHDADASAIQPPLQALLLTGVLPLLLLTALPDALRHDS